MHCPFLSTISGYSYLQTLLTGLDSRNVTCNTATNDDEVLLLCRHC